MYSVIVVGIEYGKRRGLRYITQTVGNKIDLLRGKSSVENFDIIAITETWIDTNNKNFVSEFNIEGYELFH